MAAEQDAAAQTGGSDPSTAYTLTPLAGTRSSILELILCDVRDAVHSQDRKILIQHFDAILPARGKFELAAEIREIVIGELRIDNHGIGLHHPRRAGGIFQNEDRLALFERHR